MKITADSSTLARVVLGVGALSVLLSVGADSATCAAGWEWSYSSKGDGPCEITEKLLSSCFGISAKYPNPQADDANGKKCQCNTIIYTLYAACSLCQSAQNTTILAWGVWSEFCDNVTVTQYPFSIPYNTSVPHWAYLDDSGGSFDPVLAKAAGRDPEASPIAPPTISLTSTTSTTVSSLKTSDMMLTPTSGTRTSSVPSSTSNGGPGNSGGSKTNVGAIAGGVIGGVVGLTALSALGFFLKKRGGRGNSNETLEPNPLAYNPAMTERVYGPPKLYNPADPSTFPSTVFSGDSSDSGGYIMGSHQTGRYNGAAEL